MSDTGWKSPTLAYSESWVDYDNVLIDDLSYSYSRDVIVFDDFAISIVGDGFESVDKQGVAESEVTFVSFGGSNENNKRTHNIIYSRSSNNPSLIVFIQMEYHVFFNLGIS